MATAPFSWLSPAEVLSAFEEYCVFKGKTKERNIRGGKSLAFPITGKQSAAYHQPGTEITGATNDPSDLNERILTLDSLMIADAAIAEVDELMAYWPARQEITRELGRAPAYEYDNRVARIIYAAANDSTEPLAKSINGRTGSTVTLGADYTDASATRQEKGDALVNAIFDARIAMEKRMFLPTTCMQSSAPRTTTPSQCRPAPLTPTSTVAMDLTARLHRATP